MIYTPAIINIIEIVIVTIPVLLVVAFVTVAERKTMASMQRRLGPNIVGYYGLLQAFADALKLLLKEYVSPTQANMVLFFLGPVITLIFSLLGYIVIPYAPGLAISDFNLGILLLLAVSSLSTYGILLAGWSANSKYAFLGSLRSTAQLISYELILSSSILLVVLLTSSLNLTVTIESQKSIWFIIPLLPIFLIFFIGAVAETNRAPFDLAEAESELVSGFMTEHSAVIFVFFFLAEYASIVLICITISILFLGGYLINIPIVETLIGYVVMILSESLGFLYEVLDILNSYIDIYIFAFDIIPQDIHVLDSNWLSEQANTYNTSYADGKEQIIYSYAIAIKSLLMIFTFIWVRASFPRIRFDQLMSYCWTVLLPLVFAFIILFPCLIYVLDMATINIVI